MIHALEIFGYVIAGIALVGAVAIAVTKYAIWGSSGGKGLGW
jgi:hypothetical protein